MSVRDVRSASMLLVEVICGFAAAAVFVRMFSTERAGPSLISVVVVVLAAATVGYFARASRDGAPRLSIAATALSVVALFIIAQTEYAGAPWALAWMRSLPTNGDAARGVIGGIIVLTLLWVRGIGAPARADNAESAHASVLFGLAVVALAAVVSPPARGPNLFGALALAYVPLALAVIAMYQVTDPDRPLRETVAHSGRWIAATIAVALIVAVIASAIDPRSLGALAPVGRSLAVALGFGVTVLLAPIFALFAAIMHLLPSLPHHHVTTQPAVQPAPAIQQPHGTPEWQIVVGRVLAGVGIALLAGGAMALIWLALRRLAPKRIDADRRQETIEDVQDSGDLLGGLLRRFRRPQRGAATSVAVRRLYHEMLADAAAAGIERRPSATPLQFAPQLDVHYASDAPSAISDAFTRSRYGRAEFDDELVTELRLRWHAARSASVAVAPRTR